MLILHQSNRTESLLDGLLELVSRPLANPLRPETILVQSQGMARWLALQIARAHGVAANLEFPFPAAFLWRLIKTASPDGDAASPYEPEAMRWALMGLLGRLRGEAGFEPLTAYLHNEADAGLKGYHLAGRLSELLDQYLIYRPDWIREWEAGGGQGWQPALWRELTRALGPHHRVTLQERLTAVLSEARLAAALNLPERLILFGIPALPASQLELFDLVSRRVETHLFWLAPSGQFWADLASRRELAAARLKHGDLDPENDLHLDAGCPLLMGLGRLGREFQGLLSGLDTQPGREDFPGLRADTVLGLLQADLAAALDQGPLPEAEQPPTDDRSLAIHSAHSPLREVEILRDQLLDLLEHRPHLEAEDILVMAPDIAAYAPLVEAVFSDPADEGLRLPFGVADQGANGPFVKAFLDLLALLGSRFPVSQTLAFLEQEPVRRALALTVDELELIRSWAREANINWGLTPGHRGRFGVPEEGIGSWRAGLDSLLLGLLTPPGAGLLHGLLPRDCLEIGQGQLLARFASFIEALSRLASEAAMPRPLAGWRELLAVALDRLLLAGQEEQAERQGILRVLDDLARDETTAQYQEPVPLEVLRVAVFDRLPAPGGRFPPGRITFSQMAPMRGIPFKIICLLGMNDTAFPREQPPLGFDLMAEAPRLGDQRRRDDDRHLFLETILSAREVLYLSYLGKNTDGGPAPPSVVISELLDHLSRRLHLTPLACERRFVTPHPLQPFSRRYFSGDGRLFAFSRQHREVAQTLLFPAVPYPGLFAGGEEGGPQTEGEIELAELIRFFVHPVRFLLRERLDLYLDPHEEELRDRERFGLDALAAYQLRQRLTERGLKGLGDDCPVAQARGEVAMGLSGRLQYAGCEAEATDLARRVCDLRGGDALPPLALRLALDQGVLVGVLADLWPAGQLMCRPGKLAGQNHADLIQLWIRHLVLCLLRPAEQPASHFVYLDGSWRYDFCPAAQDYLNGLLDLYRYGQRRPLPLLPQSSLAYAKKRWAGKEEGAPEQAQKAARVIWETGDFQREPECRDPYLAAAFGDLDPLAGEGHYDFPEVARLALAPPLTQGRKALCSP